MAILSDRDAARWHRLAGAVAAIVEPRLSSSVLANRAVGPGPSWRLAPFRPALAQARRLARALPGPVILRTDVAEFYPSVRPAVLFDALGRLGVPAEVAWAVADLVEGWGSEGSFGLPIGPPGSAVMANAVLASADGALARRPFLRWVDDYLVSTPGGRGAEDALDRLHDALGRLGLRLAQSKTGFLEPGPGVGWLCASGG